jgi:dipeptidyl aminopeptidase/acylaminoacyl peptidase
LLKEDLEREENVHIQNSIKLAYVLQGAGKQFDFMTYPKSRLAVTDPLLVGQMREMMLKYILDNL